MKGENLSGAVKLSRLSERFRRVTQNCLLLTASTK